MKSDCTEIYFEGYRCGANKGTILDIDQINFKETHVTVSEEHI